MIAASTLTYVEFPKLGFGPWTLNRFLVQELFGKLSIAWYGAIICAGILLACFLTLHFAKKREGISTDSMLDYCLLCIPLGVVGARLMYVLSKLEDYHSFKEVIAVWNGGLAIYGAIIAGLITLLVVSRVKKLNPLSVLDSIIPGLLIAQSIGRWGNFVNGEAFGTETDLPWGMIVNGRGPVHPTFLYESLLTLTGFLIVTFVLYPRKKFHGENFYFYLVWYGVGRTLIEGLRTDSLYVGPLRLAQCIGVLSAVTGAALILFTILAKKGRVETTAGADESSATEETAESETKSEDKADAEKDTEKKGEKKDDDAAH